MHVEQTHTNAWIPVDGRDIEPINFAPEEIKKDHEAPNACEGAYSDDFLFECAGLVKRGNQNILYCKYM